jgi:DNA polymerase elongation subunit (family B)
MSEPAISSQSTTPAPTREVDTSIPLFIYTTRYIDGLFFLFCLDKQSIPYTLCVVEHETYLYAKSNKPFNCRRAILNGEQYEIEKDLAESSITIESPSEIHHFLDAHSLSFHKTAHHKIYVKGYPQLLKATRVLSAKGYSIAEYPKKEAKFYSDKKMKHCQWIEVNKEDLYYLPMRDYTTNRNTNVGKSGNEEYVILSSSIKEPSPETQALLPPKVLEVAFDIETYASTYGINGSLRMPIDTVDEDVVYCISVILSWSDSNVPLEAVCFCIHHSDIRLGDFVEARNFNPNNIDMKVICVPDEETLLREFFSFIRMRDPDVIFGHNSSSYDWKYIAGRCDYLLENFKTYGRLISFNKKIKMGNREVEVKLDLPETEEYISNCWEGVAGSWNEFHVPLCYGRIILDTMVLFKKLQTSPGTPGALQGHGLNHLGSYLLGETKTGMTYAETFYAYRSGITSEIAKICEYCIQDSMLCMGIYHKGREWIATREASFIFYQDINQVTVTGQNAKIYTNFLRTLEEMGFAFHPYTNISKFKVKGGHVETPVKGKHTDVAVIDFASLYPTIIQAKNICLSTFIKTLPNPLPEGWSEDDFTKYDIPIEVDVHALPARYEEALGEDGEEIDPSQLENPLYIDNIIKYNNLNPDYRDSFVEMLRQKHGMDEKKVFDRLVFYIASKEKRAGILPHMEKLLTDTRTEYKNRKSTAEKRAEQAEKEMNSAIERGDMIAAKIKEEEKRTALVEKELYDNRQKLVKVVMNSIYGLLGSMKGKMSFPECAAAITYTGRTYILKVREMLVNKGFRIIYGDTDSLMFQIPGYNESLASEVSRLSAPLTKGVVEIVQAVTDEINATMPPPMTMEFEKVINAIFVDRKRYMGFKKWEGVECCKLFVMGAAAVRGDTTPFARVVYTETLELILADKPYEEVKSYLDEKLQELKEGKVGNERLAVHKKLAHSYAKETAPMRVYSQYLHSIGEKADPGTKIPLVVVRPPAGQSGPKSLFYRPPTTTEALDTEHYAEMTRRPITQLLIAAYNLKSDKSKDNEQNE